MRPLADDEIPPVVALGRQVAEQAARSGQAPPPANSARAAWVQALEKADQKA
jgi:hypothetical protein